MDETLKEQETKAFLQLSKDYEMALEEIKALRDQIRILENQLYSGGQ
jgi:cell division septum initiation protein DivIVA